MTTDDREAPVPARTDLGGPTVSEQVRRYLDQIEDEAQESINRGEGVNAPWLVSNVREVRKLLGGRERQTVDSFVADADKIEAILRGAVAPARAVTDHDHDECRCKSPATGTHRHAFAHSHPVEHRHEHEHRPACPKGCDEGVHCRNCGALVPPERPWDHPYEAGSDNICVHCGQVGSYIHAQPVQTSEEK